MRQHAKLTVPVYRGNLKTMSKQAVRQKIRTLLQTLPPEAFQKEGLQVLPLLRESPLWEKHRRVLFFLSTDREIDTVPLMEAAFSGKKEVYVPKIEGESLAFYRIYSPDGPWSLGAFNIREPETVREEDALKAAGEPLLILVPGLAFDLRGGRLGRGKGCYDRFFAGLELPGEKTGPAKKNYTALGLCLEAQIIPRVPAETWDKPMDALCTGTSLRYCKRTTICSL
ncbi:MAG: 5-formyltetrahydrofolate cyclo-ligase [Spirochaetaceae bacterium]|jgi:5-formyltetrahydrofolate cyclo-ligase|nr:5-formyltetrahydrofolate cyclo-ligase [Spirochaetaceae bacterium]